MFTKVTPLFQAAYVRYKKVFCMFDVGTSVISFIVSDVVCNAGQLRGHLYSCMTVCSTS